MPNDKARLLHLLIHDLRGPLSIVAAASNNLRCKPDHYGSLTDDQKRLLDRILRNTAKAQGLVQEMTEILRSEEGVFEAAPFAVGRSLKVSHATRPGEFQALLSKHGMVLDVSGPYAGAPFCHDEKKVQQILRNLLSNALKYRRERMGAHISGEAELIIAVEDDGLGIPAEEHAAVFAPFVQLHQQGGGSGLGFGLTGVKALVEAMGGEIRLDSRERVGTRFTVRIPPCTRPEAARRR
jgi:signal transduction histidine kinase